jgi:hypothetical protein
MIVMPELQFLWNTGFVAPRQHCKNALPTLQMIAPVANLVLKNVSLMLPLLALIGLFRMMTVWFVLVLLIEHLDLLNLSDLPFAQMIGLRDQCLLVIDTRDQ